MIRERVLFIFYRKNAISVNASVGPEIFRIARTTTILEKFKLLCAKMISRMIKQEIPQAESNNILVPQAGSNNIFVKSVDDILNYLDQFHLHVDFLTFLTC